MRNLLFAILFLGFACVAFAMPALDTPYKVVQPDGSELQLRTVGNEHFHFVETLAGDVVEKDDFGFYKYVNEDGNLSDAYALENVAPAQKFNKKNVLQKLEERRSSSMGISGYRLKALLPKVRRLPAPNAGVATGEKNILVLLVQFADVKFSSKDPQAEYNEYMNGENYNGHHNVGSVREYFIENSMGAFQPKFDVVGPITLSQKYYESYGDKSELGGTLGGAVALMEALDSVVKKKAVDFSKYDNDKDGIVDFVYMFYAGLGSNDSGQDSALWPHAAEFSIFTKYGIFGGLTNEGFRVGKSLYVDKYACSNELDGQSYRINEKSTVLSGIGSFVHEFSHTLGLPDLYDTRDVHDAVGSWDIMARGSYNCILNEDRSSGCSPPYYSAFDRLSLGWMDMENLPPNGAQSLEGIHRNKAYMVTSPTNPNEFFILEYRARMRWDSALPNHGMLLWHIDYDEAVWEKNILNVTDHQHVDIVEADGMEGVDSEKGDPFPGSKKIKTFNEFFTWDGNDLEISLNAISESVDFASVDFYVNDIEESSSSVESSSSKIASSSSEVQSSSSEASSSSVVSSSSESAALALATPTGVRCNVDGGNVYLSVPYAGVKTLQLFTVAGQLVYETKFVEQTANVALPVRFAGKSLVLLLQIDGKKLTFLKKFSYFNK